MCISNSNNKISCQKFRYHMRQLKIETFSHMYLIVNSSMYFLSIKPWKLAMQLCETLDIKKLIFASFLISLSRVKLHHSVLRMKGKPISEKSIIPKSSKISLVFWKPEPFDWKYNFVPISVSSVSYGRSRNKDPNLGMHLVLKSRLDCICVFYFLI